MNIWWVFGYDNYYPCGGLDDLRGSFPTEEEAKEFASSIYSGWDVVEVINITEHLKCCGNCKNDIYWLSPICVQCTRGVQITTASDKKDNWESK